MISGFNGSYQFLSNFWFATVRYDGTEYPTVEHAYQAAKTPNLHYREKIRRAHRPGEAKRLGRKATLRHDWEDVKIDVMYVLVKEKFTRHPHLAQRLINTGDQTLIEENTWGDRFWGMDPQGNGKNVLGEILMIVRNEIQ